MMAFDRSNIIIRTNAKQSHSRRETALSQGRNYRVRGGSWTIYDLHGDSQGRGYFFHHFRRADHSLKLDSQGTQGCCSRFQKVIARGDQPGKYRDVSIPRVKGNDDQQNYGECCQKGESVLRRRRPMGLLNSHWARVQESPRAFQVQELTRNRLQRLGNQEDRRLLVWDRSQERTINHPHY